MEKKTKDERSTFFLLRLKLNITEISESQTSISIPKTFLTKRKLKSRTTCSECSGRN